MLARRPPSAGFPGRVRQGEQVIGSFVLELPVRGCLEAMALAGLDFVILDLEHSATDFGTLSLLIATARSCGLGAIVRLEAGSLGVATRVLDMRPDGIMIPGVENREQGRAVVEACRYHPHGSRGLAPIVRHEGAYAEVDAATLVIVQLEHVDVLAVAAEVAGVEGLDVIFIGPYDLSQSLGIPGELAHPRVISAGRSVAAEITATTRMGVYASGAEAAAPWVEMGATFIAMTTDGQLLLHACNELALTVDRASWRTASDAATSGLGNAAPKPG